MMQLLAPVAVTARLPQQDQVVKLSQVAVYQVENPPWVILMLKVSKAYCSDIHYSKQVALYRAVRTTDE